MYGRNRGYVPYRGGGIPGMTPMVQRIIFANCIVWAAQLLSRMVGIPLTELGAVRVDGFLHLQLWQPFTYMWLHAPDNPLHLLFNMWFLWMVAPELEMTWGSRRFLRFYVICGVGAGLFILAWNSLFGAWDVPTVGASGAIYGVITAFTLLNPDRMIMLLIPPMPIRAIWLVPLLFLMQFLLGGGERVSYTGHLGGVLVAAFMLRTELRRVLGWRTLSNRWHRMRMRNRLRAVRRDELERRRNDDQNRPTYH